MKKLFLLIVLLVLGLAACTKSNKTDEEVFVAVTPDAASVSGQEAAKVENVTEMAPKPTKTKAVYMVEEQLPPDFYSFDAVDYFTEQGYACVMKDGKWGVMNASGKLVLPTEYEFVHGDAYEGFFDGLLRIMQKGKYGFADMDGNVVIPLEYDWVSDFTNGYAGVNKDKKYGIIDTTGSVVVPLNYDALQVLPNGLAAVEKDKKSGVINMSEKIVVPLEHERLSILKYDHIYNIELIAFYKDGLYAIADLAGNLLSGYEYEYIDFFSDGYAVVRKEGGKWGYIDPTGNEVISAEYDWAFSFHNGLASVRKDDKNLFIDKTGKLAFENGGLGFDKSYNVTGISDEHGKWGALDRNGNIIIPMQYYYLSINGEDGLIWVAEETDSGWATGWFDVFGNVVVPVEARQEGPFGSGAAEGFISIFNTDTLSWGYADYKGNIVINLKYADAVGNFNSGLAPVQHQNGLWGYINSSGEMIVPYSYDEAQEFRNGYAWVKKDGKWGILHNLTATDKTPNALLRWGFAYDDDGIMDEMEYTFPNAVKRLVSPDEYILHINGQFNPALVYELPTGEFSTEVWIPLSVVPELINSKPFDGRTKEIDGATYVESTEAAKALGLSATTVPGWGWRSKQEYPLYDINSRGTERPIFLAHNPIIYIAYERPRGALPDDYNAVMANIKSGMSKSYDLLAKNLDASGNEYIQKALTALRERIDTTDYVTQLDRFYIFAGPYYMILDTETNSFYYHKFAYGLGGLLIGEFDDPELFRDMYFAD